MWQRVQTLISWTIYHYLSCLHLHLLVVPVWSITSQKHSSSQFEISIACFFLFVIIVEGILSISEVWWCSRGPEYTLMMLIVGCYSYRSILPSEGGPLLCAQWLERKLRCWMTHSHNITYYIYIYIYIYRSFWKLYDITLFFSSSISFQPQLPLSSGDPLKKVLSPLAQSSWLLYI